MHCRRPAGRRLALPTCSGLQQVTASGTHPACWHLGASAARGAASAKPAPARCQQRSDLRRRRLAQSRLLGRPLLGRRCAADHLGQPAELVSKAGQSQPGPAVLAEGCSFCNFSGQTGQRQAGCRRSGRLGGQVWDAPLQRCDGTPDLPLLRPLTGGRWPGFRCRRLGCQPWCQLDSCHKPCTVCWAAAGLDQPRLGHG